MEIKLLRLQTDKLKKLKEFYIDYLGFSLCDISPNSFQIEAGTSILEFTNDNIIGEPYYHFAFNIPSNLLHEAKAWLKEKTTLLLEDGETKLIFHFGQHALVIWKTPQVI